MLSGTRFIIAGLRAGRNVRALSSRAIDSQTPLHTAVMGCTDPEQIRAVIARYPDAVSDMAVTTNDMGCTPIELLNTVDLAPFEIYKVRDTLVDLIKRQQVKPLSQPIEPEDVVDNAGGNVLHESMEAARLAANAARATIKYSSTHPDLNEKDAVYQQKIAHLVIAKRQYINDPYDPDEIAHTCSQMMVGNCFELSLVAIHYLQQLLERRMRADLVCVVNGDHVFTVLSDKTNLENEKQASKAEAAVICDPYRGVVGEFNADNVIKYIGTFKRVTHENGRMTNYIATFNPACHQLYVARSFFISGVNKDKKHIMSCPEIKAMARDMDVFLRRP